MLKKFHTVVEQYSVNTNIQSGFNICDFKNTGSCNLTVNGIPLTPGTSYTVLGYEGEIDMTSQYIIAFDVAGSNPQITVVKKIYN